MNYPTEFINYCLNTKVKLTSLRKSILFMLWSLSKPVKAYELLERLKEKQVDCKPAALYRVLDYFEAEGIIHKIESIQAFTLCSNPEQHLPSELILLCSNCHNIQEHFNSNLLNLIQELAKSNSFYLGQDTIEIKGLCQNCNLQP